LICGKAIHTPTLSPTASGRTIIVLNAAGNKIQADRLQRILIVK